MDDYDKAAEWIVEAVELMQMNAPVMKSSAAFHAEKSTVKHGISNVLRNRLNAKEVKVMSTLLDL